MMLLKVTNPSHMKEIRNAQNVIRKHVCSIRLQVSHCEMPGIYYHSGTTEVI